MPYVLIQHEVPEVSQLISAFLHDHVRRQELGSRGGRMFANVDDEHQFVVLLEWDEVENARRLIATPDFMKQLISEDDVRFHGNPLPPKISILEEIAWVAS
jgi:hypothetical protein